MALFPTKQKPRIDILISEALVHELERDTGVPIDELIRRGVALLGSYRDVRAAGYPHMGFAHSRRQLDIPYVGQLF